MKNDYYVYLHKTLDGEVFYVGKGRCKRAKSKAYRSKEWHAVATKGYLIEYYATDLTESKSLEIESNLINTLEGLVNTRIFNKLDFDDLHDCFKVDPTVPSGLVRIKGFWTGRYEKGILGAVGYVQKRKEEIKGWVITHQGKCVSVHRIIWQLVNGNIPNGMIVDHVDGDPLNNRIENLRLVDAKTNSRNKKQYKNNTTGVTGVTEVSTGFAACWRDIEGIERRKNFNSKILGKEQAFRLACEYRAEQIRLLNEQGAGYTERHGT